MKQIAVFDHLHRSVGYADTLEEARIKIDELKQFAGSSYMDSHMLEILYETTTTDGLSYESLELYIRHNANGQPSWVKTTLDSFPKIHAIYLLEKPMDGYYFEVKSYPCYPPIEGSEERYFLSDEGAILEIPIYSISTKEEPQQFEGSYFFFDYKSIDILISQIWKDELDLATRKLEYLEHSIEIVESSSAAFLSEFKSSIQEFKKSAKVSNFPDIEVVSFRLQDMSDLHWIQSSIYYGKIYKENQTYLLQQKNRPTFNFSQHDDVFPFPNVIELKSKGMIFDKHVKLFNELKLTSYSLHIHRRMITTSNLNTLTSLIRQNVLILLRELQQLYSYRTEYLEKQPSLGFVLMK